MSNHDNYCDTPNCNCFREHKMPSPSEHLRGIDNSVNYLEQSFKMLEIDEHQFKFLCKTLCERVRKVKTSRNLAFVHAIYHLLRLIG